MMNEYNEKTAVRTRRVPFRPAQDTDTEQSANVLPVGTHLGEFEILDLIGEGGFGIVYLAYDHSLERHVALKEYMPSGLATRTTKMAVTVRSQRNVDTFTAGLKSFINEARMLAQFDSPSLVKVHRFWEGNGTAYMVMPFYEGTTLKQALKERRIVPTEPWIRMLLADLFDAIETIHAAHCLHRDIAPDNILLLKDGRPLLLDFGAARRVIGDLTQRLTVILKPGFAPIEQYANSAGLRQGAWTDIYALAGVVYYLITGKAPPPAVARMVHDEMVPAREAGKGRYSNTFLAAIDKALAVRPEQRFRSITEMRRALGILETVPRTLPRSNSEWSTTIARTAPAAESAAAPMPDAPPDEEPATQVDVEWRKFPGTEPPFEGRSRRGKPAWLMMGLLLSAGIAAGVYWEIRQPQQPWDASLSESTADTSADTAALQSSGDSEVPEQDVAEQTAEPPAAEPPAVVAPLAKAPSSPPSPAADVTPPATAPADEMASGGNGRQDAADQESEEPAPSKPAQAEAAAPSPRLPAEIELWRMASASDKASAYENYLKEYPNGRYAALARLRLERKQPKIEPKMAMNAPAAIKGIKPSSPPPPAKPAPVAKENAAVVPSPAAPATATPARSDDEKELWKAATTINEPPAYESYLNLYPQGRYAGLAKDKLASFKPREPAPPVSPPTVEKQQEPAAAATEPDAPKGADMQASIKPAEPAVPSTPKERAEAMPKPAPAPEPPPAASDKKTLKLDDQTMVGDFSADSKTGIVSGTGKIIWKNGNQFEGTLVRGIKEGKGKFVWANGQRYSGDWARDMPNGKGTIVFANGNRYEGDVKDGLPHGQGVTRFKDGDVYSGYWLRGKSHGHGRYTWANGSYWEGEFRDDKRTENGTMVFSEAALRAARNSPPTAVGKAPPPEVR